MPYYAVFNINTPQHTDEYAQQKNTRNNHTAPPPPPPEVAGAAAVSPELAAEVHDDDEDDDDDMNKDEVMHAVMDRSSALVGAKKEWATQLRVGTTICDHGFLNVHARPHVVST